MLSFAKLEVRLPVIVTSFAKVAFSATVKNLLAVILPLTCRLSLIIASLLTYKWLLSETSPITFNFCDMVTFLERVSVGKAPPTIAADGMLSFAKLEVRLPVIVTFFAKVAFSATVK